MKTEHSFLVDLVERSASLSERGSSLFSPAYGGPPSPEAQARWRRWKEQLTKGNESFFERRLSWDGLHEGSALHLLQGAAYTREALPSWAELIGKVLDCNAELAGRPIASGPVFEESSPFPFEEVLAPFVQVAAQELTRQRPQCYEYFTGNARAELERSFLASLSVTGERCLNADFAAWKAMPEWTGHLDPSRPLYSGYVLMMRREGMRALFRGLPVLARLLGRITEQWIANVCLFTQHLAQDREGIAEHLFGGRDPGPVSALRIGISDRHQGGRSVFEVRFTEGLCCFYKPRDCRSEQAFNDLLRCLNDCGETLALPTYALLLRPDHSWAEKVYAAPCETEAEVHRFFHRAGLLTAVLYSLEASDCNFENIIAAGESPVLIDAETLLQPRPQIDEADTWKALAAATEQMFYDSVLRIHILPRWIAQRDGEKMDVSGFASGRNARGTVQAKVWSDINTDAMKLSWETRPFKPAAGRSVSLRGEAVVPEDYLDDLLAGFEAMYRLLMSKKEQLWDETGPLPVFTTLRSRIVVRNTHIYVGLYGRLLEPGALRDGADASVTLDMLSRLFADAVEKPLQWPIVAAETRALLDANIPRFEAACASDTLESDDGTSIPGYFREPAADVFRRRFHALSNTDLDLQKRYIRCSFSQHGDVSARNITSETISKGNEAPSGEHFLDEALAIARTLRQHAITASDGTASWITQSYNAESQFWQVQPIGFFLYDGICGIGLFLAALKALTRTSEFDDLSQATLAVLRQLSSPEMRYHLERKGVGAGLGTASLAYSVARIAAFYGDSSLLEVAMALARRISPEMIREDRRLDTIGGAAGCLLVLRALDRLSPSGFLRDLAITCGDHLLAAQTPAPNGLPAWKTIRGKHLAGFSHGAAGIGYALAQLYAWTGEKRFAAAAAQAQAYEATLFDKEEGNWPNLLLPRKTGGHEFWNSWCHGAPGIGLGRLGSLESCDSAEVRLDLERALTKAALPELTELDFLCCGNLGRIELLIEAANKLERPEYLAKAREMSGAVMRRADERGRYGVSVKDGLYVPSFHQGMAGVGYQMLRVADPGRVPSVLSWA